MLAAGAAMAAPAKDSDLVDEIAFFQSPFFETDANIPSRVAAIRFLYVDGMLLVWSKS
jgi:hypothetical protein